MMTWMKVKWQGWVKTRPTWFNAVRSLIARTELMIHVQVPVECFCNLFLQPALFSILAEIGKVKGAIYLVDNMIAVE